MHQVGKDDGEVEIDKRMFCSHMYWSYTRFYKIKLVSSVILWCIAHSSGFFSFSLST